MRNSRPNPGLKNMPDGVMHEIFSKLTPSQRFPMRLVDKEFSRIFPSDRNKILHIRGKIENIKNDEDQRMLTEGFKIRVRGFLRVDKLIEQLIFRAKPGTPISTILGQYATYRKNMNRILRLSQFPWNTQEDIREIINEFPRWLATAFWERRGNTSVTNIVRREKELHPYVEIMESIDKNTKRFYAGPDEMELYLTQGTIQKSRNRYARSVSQGRDIFENSMRTLDTINFFTYILKEHRNGSFTISIDVPYLGFAIATTYTPNFRLKKVEKHRFIAITRPSSENVSLTGMQHLKLSTALADALSELKWPWQLPGHTIGWKNFRNAWTEYHQSLQRKGVR